MKRQIKRALILSSVLLMGVTDTFAGTNTGRTCCCVGPAKRYHADAHLSKVTLNWAYVQTGWDAWGNPVYSWVPYYAWTRYKRDVRHICYSNTTAEVYDGWHINGQWKDAKAHAERGPSAHVQWSWSNNPQISAGEEFGFYANQEIDWGQHQGTANSQHTYGDIRVEGGQLLVENLTGFNAVGNGSTFQSSLRIIVYRGVLEDYLVGDPNDPHNHELDVNAIPKLYETSLKVTANGVTGNGFLFDNFGQNFEVNTFQDYNLADVSGVKYSNFNLTLPLNTTLPDDSLGVLILADDGIDYDQLVAMYGFNPGGNGPALKMTKPATAAAFSIAPNPTTGSATLHLQELEAGEYSLTVFNAEGKKVKEDKLTIGQGFSGTINIDLTGSVPGNYFVNVKGGKFNQTQKLLLKQ